MKTSLKGICSILAHEAIVLSTYDDGVGVLTIGAGHTAMAGAPTPTPGMTISLVEAINIFRRDIKKYESGVKNALTVSVNQHQFDALVSWHYNTGSIATATLTKKLNDGDMSGAATEFARWNKAGGNVLKGLTKRRKEEAAIFSNADYGDPNILVFKTKGGSTETLDKDDVLDLMQPTGHSESDLSTEELLANPNSALLPKFRPKQKDQVSLAAYENFLDLVPEERRDDPIKVLAVRGYYTNSMGKEGQNDRGLYDDAIFIIEPDGVHNFNGNTDPSRFRNGIAKLKAPQAVRYVPGLHGFKRKKGPYPAFRQNSECTVERDQKGDDTGIFWINLHRGGNSTTSSAGCQTVPPNQWNEFKALLDNLLAEYAQKTFYYVLIDQRDVPPESSVISPIIPPETTTPKKPEGDKPMAARDSTEIIDIVRTLLTLVERIRSLRGAQPEVLPQNSENADIVKSLLAALGGQPNASVAPQPTPPAPPTPVVVVPPAAEDLTPVNSVLGDTIGKVLDGRKTAIGAFGLIATSVLPVLFPQLSPIIEVAKQIAETSGGDVAKLDPTTTKTVVSTATPLFSALLGWGVLGKIDKWVADVKGTKTQ